MGRACIKHHPILEGKSRHNQGGGAAAWPHCGPARAVGPEDFPKLKSEAQNPSAVLWQSRAVASAPPVTQGLCHSLCVELWAAVPAHTNISCCFLTLFYFLSCSHTFCVYACPTLGPAALPPFLLSAPHGCNLGRDSRASPGALSHLPVPSARALPALWGAGDAGSPGDRAGTGWGHELGTRRCRALAEQREQGRALPYPPAPRAPPHLAPCGGELQRRLPLLPAPRGGDETPTGRS